ncbi:MAG: hypothetical protein AB8H80_17120 [Planctomycetota bacterium]
MKSIRELIVRMATDNSGWGYLRIRGELKKVGHTVARTTIAKTLKDNGINRNPLIQAEIAWADFSDTAAPNGFMHQRHSCHIHLFELQTRIATARLLE